MNLAPLLHTDLTMETRAELAAAGFTALELFKLLSEERCRDMKLPKGSCQMAPQSIANLVGVSLHVLVMSVTLDPEMDPWRFGTLRLSELPVEQWFSACRAQSNNSQLSTRGYWQASARTSLKNSKVLNSQKAVGLGNHRPLTEDEFLGRHNGMCLC